MLLLYTLGDADKIFWASSVNFHREPFTTFPLLPSYWTAQNLQIA